MTNSAVNTDTGVVLEALNDKLDRDVNNISGGGRSTVTSYGFPSDKYIDLELKDSGSTYTAPADGFFTLNKLTNAENQYANFVNVVTGMNTTLSYPKANSNIRIYIPISKNGKITCTYSAGGETKYFRFIYAKGVEPNE